MNELYIYAFGSICRGELEIDSDFDVLVIGYQIEEGLYNSSFSTYTPDKIIALWEQGSPFAHHLFHESKIIYSNSGKNFLLQLGNPSNYQSALADCEKFKQLFSLSSRKLKSSSISFVFELSNIFLATRNIAICYSLFKEYNIFNRDAALKLPDFPLEISSEGFSILERSRILSSRGLGKPIKKCEHERVVQELSTINEWIAKLILEIKNG